jgi:trehalose/maltose transport system substrate-binding protein
MLPVFRLRLGMNGVRCQRVAHMPTRFKAPGTGSRISQGIRFWTPRSFRLGPAVVAILLASVSAGCRKPAEAVTLTFLDPQGLLDLGDRRMVSDAAIKEFTQETGIRVNHLPTPQDNRAQLQLIRDLLQRGVSAPDVYGVDTIWSGALADYLVDLKPYFPSDLSLLDPEVLASYTVQGKLIAMPYHPNSSVLYYREDLLRKYGYSLPPKTWDELETMAARIQKGERESGRKDFWGFIWPGTVRESLSHIALEWQVSEGGGRVIEADRTISVNNPNTVRAWERGARWVGWITPPGVTSYSEWDSSNAFWIAGNAAFARGWADYFERHPPEEPFHQQAGVTSIPAGKAARVSALGGWALAVSSASAHRAEAIRLVEFLVKKEAEVDSVARSKPQWQLQFYDLPVLLAKKYPWAPKAGDQSGATIVSRPSNVSGAHYDEVSRAYSEAVHSVLTHEATASQAASKLEKELVRITGFETTHK